MSTVLPRFTALAAFACALAAATAAHAERRIVVLNIKGMESSSLQRAVEDMIRDDHEIISGNQYVREAIKLKAESRTTENFRKVAAKLGADGLLETRVTRDGKSYILTLTVRSGSSGLAIDDPIQVDYDRRPRLDDDPDTRDQLRDMVLDLIDELPRIDRAAMSDGEGGEKAAAMPAPMRARMGLGIVSAGASVTSRELAFSSIEFLNEPKGYEGGFVPGAFIAGEIYLLAGSRAKRGRLADVGVSFVFDRAIGLQTGLDGGVQVPTSQQRYGVGLRYRLNLGDEASGPTFTFGAAYNKLEFAIDPIDVPMGANVDFPNTAYTFFDPGVSIRFPLGSKLAVLAGGAGLLILDTGQIQAPEQYGSATVTGVDANLGIEYFATERVVVRAAARFLKIGMDFNEFPDGELTGNRDGDPMTIETGGAGDTYMGATVVLGYLL